MEEINAPVDIYDYQSDDGDEQLFSLQSKAYSKFSNKPGLCSNDLMSNRELDYLEDSSNESVNNEFNYKNGKFYDNKDNNYSDDNKNNSEDNYSSENQDYQQYSKYQQNKFKDDEHLDLSYPKQDPGFYQAKNYDTRDTIDNQLENLKNCFRQEEESKYCFNLYNNKEQKSSDDYLTFQNTLNNNTYSQREQQNMFSGKINNIQQNKFMKTDGDIFEKQNKDLGDRLEIMKSAAARMISSNYDNKSEISSLQSYSKVQDNNYYKNQEGEFDSSTNNLINSSRARIQQIDQTLKSHFSSHSNERNCEEQNYSKQQFNQAEGYNKSSRNYSDCIQASSSTTNKNRLFINSDQNDFDNMKNMKNDNTISNYSLDMNKNQVTDQYNQIRQNNPLLIREATNDLNQEFGRINTNLVTTSGQNESRLKINTFMEINTGTKITTNFMENELLILQQKIAGLEK